MNGRFGDLDMRAFDGSTVLVTGGAGFVGSNLAHTLLEQTALAKLVLVDNFLSSEHDNVPRDSRVVLITGSIADVRVLQQLPDAIKFVFHLACYHGNQSSIYDPIADHDNNSITSLQLFEHLHKRDNLEKVVYAAAGCAVAEKTFDEPAATSEDAAVSLFHDSPYSISKLVGEMYGNYYFRQYRFPFVKARFQNVYGPREILGAGRWRGTAHTIWRNVIPTFIWRALNDEPLPLENEGRGTRDFIFVDDLVEGLIRCTLVGKPGEAYNLGSGKETSVATLASLIIAQSDSKSNLEFRDTREWDKSGRRFAATEKSTRELAFQTRVSMEVGIARTLEWSTTHRDLIQRNIIKHLV
jgi:nucleoside-diphosphate-sugar epimerase